MYAILDNALFDYTSLKFKLENEVDIRWELELFCY